MILFSDSTQFYGVLINHISKVLQARDFICADEKDWVVNEAMNPRSLQHGGTFRNALSRKVTGIVIPIFSELIANIDHNYNLDLIDPKHNDPPLTNFWLSMFRESSVLQFNYADMINPRKQVPWVGRRKAGENYKCELPFSWLIHEAVDSQWSIVWNIGSEKVLQSHLVVYILLVSGVILQWSRGRGGSYYMNWLAPSPFQLVLECLGRISCAQFLGFLVHGAR